MVAACTFGYAVKRTVYDGNCTTRGTERACAVVSVHPVGLCRTLERKKW